MRGLLGIGVLIAGLGVTPAGSADMAATEVTPVEIIADDIIASDIAADDIVAGTVVNLFSVYADPLIPVAAIQTTFDVVPGKAIRLAVYDSEEAFLENARAKHQAPVDARGLAVLPLAGLEPGEYAFAVYLDLNGDGKLNRGKFLGRPKEPVAFSNGAKAKLRKPRYDEAKVTVEPGSVVVITLND
ncbi:hypothetical protein MNBD_ALPHA05-1841 [hydrothermal vent metagenome]|uniref:DUF2141 domain-containing protein n=1 Tax=hydrothermal vent metagenome TaxID=652676 RepID=A0A3B0SP35_9ZZZZ